MDEEGESVLVLSMRKDSGCGFDDEVLGSLEEEDLPGGANNLRKTERERGSLALIVNDCCGFPKEASEDNTVKTVRQQVFSREYNGTVNSSLINTSIF